MPSSKSYLRVPGHRNWKKTTPNAFAMNLIRQVNYDLEFDEEDNDGMLDVYEINILKPKNEARNHWRRFPAAYFAFLKRFLYRFELYVDIHDINNEERGRHSFTKNSLRELKLYIQYMDSVLVDAWEQCRVAAVNDELGPDWRCPALDKWLCLEFHIKRHNIEDVERRITSAASQLEEDPFEFEWTEYETSMPDWHHGGKYDYQIANMQDKDLRGVIPELVRWLDHESETSGKEEEEGGEANEDSNGEEVKDKEATSEGKQARIPLPKKKKTASKGKAAATAPSDDGKKTSTSKSVIKSKEVVGSTSKGKKAGPPTEEVQSIANESNVGSDAEMQSEIADKKDEVLATSSKRQRKPTTKLKGKDPLSPMIKEEKKSLSKSKKRPEKDSTLKKSQISNAESDKGEKTVIFVKREKGGPTAKSKAEKEGKRAYEETANTEPEGATASGGGTNINSRREKRREFAASAGRKEGPAADGVKETSAAGKKRKSRGSLDVVVGPLARRSSRNKTQVPEDSPSASLVPLSSIASTPAPSHNDEDMEDWGTGIPSGALFGLASGSQSAAAALEDDGNASGSDVNADDEEADA